MLVFGKRRAYPHGLDQLARRILPVTRWRPGEVADNPRFLIRSNESRQRHVASCLMLTQDWPPAASGRVS